MPGEVLAGGPWLQIDSLEALETLAHVMRQPNSPPAARVLAANSLLDRGWGKAAQLVAVDGDVKHLVEVKLSVVPALRADAQPNLKVIDAPTTSLLANSEKPNDINANDLSNTERAVERRQGRQVIPPEGSGPSSGRGRGKVWQGDPVNPAPTDPKRMPRLDEKNRAQRCWARLARVCSRSAGTI